MIRRLMPTQTSLPGIPTPVPTKAQKVAHVKAQGQTRKHECHWPGCTEQVPPAMWGCKAHWFRLPLALRNKIWLAYRPGQEGDMRPSDAYMTAAREVQDWIGKHGGQP
jgi:hypothetical protein